jgi:hypothetical protein
MREKVSPWGDGVDDTTLAYALLGIGLIPSRLYTQPAVALQAIAATLKEDAGLIYRWRFDATPTAAQWKKFPSAESVAAVVKDYSLPRPMRFSLLPGPALPTTAFYGFVRSTLGPSDVTTHIACQSSKRPVRLRWPLRIGFLPGPSGAEHVTDLTNRDSWSGNVYEAFVMSRRQPECDVLVCIEHANDAKTMLEGASRSLGPIRADIVMVFSTTPGGGNASPARLEEVRAIADAGGIAHVDESLGDPIRVVRDVCIEVSHNHTLDVALAYATQARALMLASADLLEASKLEFKVQELATALTTGAEAKIAIDRPGMGQWAERAAEEGRMGEKKVAATTEKPRPPVRRGAGSGSGFGVGYGRAGRPTTRARPPMAAPPPPPPPPPMAAPAPAPPPMPAPAPEPAVAAAAAPEPAARRIDMGRYLRRSAGAREWHSESSDASDLGRVMRSLAEEDASQTAARYLQAGFASEKKPEAMLKSLKPANSYLVNVFIGTARKGYSRGGESFPDIEPRKDGRAHELDVVFWEPKLSPKPQVLKMQLPPLGSTMPVNFPLKTRKNTKSVNARISVLHRNRVLQTGMLTAPVGRRGEIVFELDAIPRRILSGLDDRTNFSMAMVLNDTEGDAAVHLMADGKSQVLAMEGEEIDDLVTAVGIAISDIADNPKNYEGLRAPASMDLLRTLAVKGALLRDHIQRWFAENNKLETPEYVQLVATKPGKIFPLEFIYDFKKPKIGAKLCQFAEQALEAGDCLQTCPRHANEAEMPKTVCPFGFWGLRCVIERKRNVQKDWTGGVEPTGGKKRGVLRPLDSVLVGATPRADTIVAGSVSGMLARIQAIATTAPPVSLWENWPDEVARTKPTTLALVVHQTKDRLKTPLIEIGAPPMLSSDDLDEEFVRAPGSETPPIVLLMGCETGKAVNSYENFSTRFQVSGAAIVVSTVATVVGRQAAPMTADILEAIKRVKDPVSFAVVMRDLRRSLLAKGTPMVLGLIADGDADWDVVGS